MKCDVCQARVQKEATINTVTTAAAPDGIVIWIHSARICKECAGPIFTRIAQLRAKEEPPPRLKQTVIKPTTKKGK